MPSSLQTRIGARLLLVAVASGLGAWPPCHEPPLDREAVDSVRSAAAGELEPGLPEVAFGEWLEETLGAAWSICWEVNDCGEQTGDPELDRGRQFPTCVEARATRAAGEVLAVTVSVSAPTAEDASRPRVFTVLGEVAGEVRELGTLAELVALARHLESSPKNESPIRFESFESEFGSFQFCWRAEWDQVPLRDSALYEWDLVRGTSCIVADFDGNGYLDFALQGYGLPKIRPERRLRVVFYERHEAVHHLDIPGAGFELYAARSEEGEFGEPASRLDGLVSGGEGGTTSIWLFDPQNKTLVRSDHASENH